MKGKSKSFHGTEVLKSIDFDGNKAAQKAIKQGLLAGLIAQDPELMGRMAVIKAFRVLAGTLDRNARKDIYVPIKLLTAEVLKEAE